MKYIALLSGGKDSCYNLLHCHKNGHELVAAASLGPEPGKEELDSYLYQTVGQDAIEFVARALEVPLYRKVITGNAVQRGSQYGDRRAKQDGAVTGDETEDLFSLLSTIKDHHPEVQGVSVGAILSNYQRVRVEHVCRRLALNPLCYLWQRDQGELLTEMIEAGMDAVLIKVAGIGLTVNHLGKTLAEMKPTLFKLNNLYGSHICGEGGEYESLTLDCPMFKHKIKLTEVETVIHSDSAFATVAYLRIKNVDLEEVSHDTSLQVPVPRLLEDHFVLMQEEALSSQLQTPIAKLPSPFISDDVTDHPEAILSSKRLGPWVVITNVQSDVRKDTTIEDEVTACFRTLVHRLSEYNLTLSQCSSINIFLSSIDLFARVNAVYAGFFGSSPPARACVAIDLPHPNHIRLDCTAFVEETPIDRHSLHVQSLSYWAPANIGPYSQAILVGERIFISGQIGLEPSSLTLPSVRDFATEIAISSQHVTRILNALRCNSGGGWNGQSLSDIYWLADRSNIIHTRKAHEVLKAHRNSSQTPVLFLVIKSLPKDALVEKQVLLHTGKCKVLDEDTDEFISQQQTPEYSENNWVLDNGGQLHFEIIQLMPSLSAGAIVCFKSCNINVLAPVLREVRSILSPTFSRTLFMRLFYISKKAVSSYDVCKAIFGLQEYPAITCIPCRSIATLQEDCWDYVFHMFVV